MEVVTGNGVEVLAQDGKADTEANSAISPQRARRRTSKTLSAADALQIVQESLNVAIEAGVEIEHGPLPDGAGYGIILSNVTFCTECKNLHLDATCPYCPDNDTGGEDDGNT